MTDQLRYKHAGGVTRIVIDDQLSVPDWIKTHLHGSPVLIIDSNLKSIAEKEYPGLLSGFPQIIEIPDGESAKSFLVYQRVIGELVAMGIDRDGLLVAAGGGVTGDLTGFAAATYLRGIRYVQVPTTLLAQIDSSIGGKTGINLDVGKNLVGAIWQPEAILVNPRFLDSLPPAEVLSALGEMFKYFVLFDRQLFVDFSLWLASHEPSTLLTTHRTLLNSWINRCISFKTHIVEQDEKESGPRALLNLGHTLGHALEKMFPYPALRHGDGVTIGIVFASLLSLRSGMLKESDFTKILATAKRLKPLLPDDGNWNSQLVKDYITRDKKKKDGAIRWILPLHPGECQIVPIKDFSIIQSALEDFPGIWYAPV